MKQEEYIIIRMGVLLIEFCNSLTGKQEQCLVARQRLSGGIAKIREQPEVDVVFLICQKADFQVFDQIL